MLDYQAIIKSDTATRLLNVFTFEYIYRLLVIVVHNIKSPLKDSLYYKRHGNNHDKCQNNQYLDDIPLA